MAEVAVTTTSAPRTAASGEATTIAHPLWDELFPAEQARLVRLLVERVEVGPHGADIRLRIEGLAGLVRELTPSALALENAA